LLDLAFVLLIIFVITTPLLEKSLDLNLPKGGKTEPQLKRNDIRTVEISRTGVYALDRERMPLSQIISRLVGDVHSNPNMVVYIRADKDCRFDLVEQVFDGCQNNGISRYSIRTDPTSR
jgi:biopolymer transport protein ExbD/biopolymer transport protein TolR